MSLYQMVNGYVQRYPRYTVQRSVDDDGWVIQAETARGETVAECWIPAEVAHALARCARLPLRADVRHSEVRP